MPQYAYKAVTASGKPSRGLHEASCMEELEARLARSHLYLIHAKERKNHFALANRISRRDLITLFFNLELFLRSGIPLLESLDGLHESTGNQKLNGIITAMSGLIENGETLSQAMAHYPQAFSKLIVSLVRAGEESGRLPDVLEHITRSLMWQDEMAAQTRNMLIYPALAGATLLAVTFFLMIFLVPQLSGFISGIGQTLPIETQALLGVSRMVQDYWHFMLALPPILAAAFMLALKFMPELQYHTDRLKLHCGPAGAILLKIILARFATTFAMMYASGLSILDCMKHSRDVAGNLAIARKLEQAAREIESGMGLGQSFRNAGIFPPLVLRMVSVGESTGQLEAVLRNIGYFYERDVKESARRMQALLEPFITLCLGLLLGWVMLSVLSPVYETVSSMKL